MGKLIEHPQITWIERTGYPSWMQEKDWDDEDEDDEEEESIWEED